MFNFTAGIILDNICNCKL